MEHRAFGIIGIVLILLIAWIASDNRKAIRLRTVGACFALQVAIAIFVLYLPAGKGVLESAANKVATLLSYADAGIGFVFGNLSDLEGFSFLVRVLPIIIFFAALMEILYHLRIMQIIVRLGGSAIRWLTDTRPVESLNVIANIFVGQTEAPLSLKPYLPSIGKPELFTIMVSGLASVSGTVLGGYIALGIEPKYLLAACFMSAPAGLLMAKMIMPDEQTGETKEDKLQNAKAVYAMAETGPRHPSIFMAAAVGAQNGVNLAVAIGAMLIAFISLIALFNGLLGWAGGWFGQDDLSLQMILGWVFSPVMWAVGVPWAETQIAGGIFGEKLVVNEFIAFGSLIEAESSLSPKSIVILSFALCGFANIGSIAILLGGIGTLIPDRMPDIARMGVKAVFAASLANLMSAALAGILVGL